MDLELSRVKTATLLSGTRARKCATTGKLVIGLPIVLSQTQHRTLSHHHQQEHHNDERHGTTKKKTMTKKKKTCSVLETVHQRADCSKYASVLGNDDNDVPSVKSGGPVTHPANTVANTLVSHVSPVCSVFLECATCVSQAVARGTVDGIRTQLKNILQG